MGKVATARRVIANEGLRGLEQAFLQQETVSRAVSSLKYWTAQHDYACLGKLASLLTETVIVDGARFVAPRNLVNDALRYRLLLGRYERPERELLRRHLDPSRPVIELGGGLGIVACTINRRLSDPKRHVVVEANPLMLDALECNRRRNGASFSIIHAAIAYSGGTAAVQFGDDCLSTTALDRATDLRVPATTLHDLFVQFPYQGCAVVCDIEGAEMGLVHRELDILANWVSLIVLEEHPDLVSTDERNAMSDKLRRAGFEAIDQSGDVRAFRNRALC